STQRKELPLDSPNWVSVDDAYRPLCGRTGSRPLAAKELYEAMRDGRVPSMRRCFGYGIRNKVQNGKVIDSERVPLGPDELLLPSHWIEHRLSVRTDGSPEVIEGFRLIESVKGYAYFVWKPALAKAWPDVFASTPSRSAPIESPAADSELLGHAKRGPKPYN